MEFPQLANAPDDQPGNQTGGRQTAARIKPPGLIVEGCDGEREVRALFSPNSAMVGGDHLEVIRAGAQSGEVRLASSARFDPAILRAAQAIPERRLLRRGEDGRRVAKLQH